MRIRVRKREVVEAIPNIKPKKEKRKRRVKSAYIKIHKTKDNKN